MPYYDYDPDSYGERLMATAQDKVEIAKLLTPAKLGETDGDLDPTPPGKRTPKRNAKRTRRNAKRRLGNVVRLVRANGGKVTASQQSMAKQLGLSKSRVNELLRELEAADRVKLRTSRTGTTVTLAA